MPLFSLATTVHAPVQAVFDLARCIDFHLDSMSRYQEKAIAGRTSGHIELGETVTWEAKHCGIRQRLTAQITAMNPPHHFTDEMVRGAFKRFQHRREFQDIPSGTLMLDFIRFESPLGPLGWLFDALVLKQYLRKLILQRNEALKRHLESP